MAKHPYSEYLDGVTDLAASLEETGGRIVSLVSTWTPAQFERTYAPGKWSARLILIHMAHMESIFGDRVRLGLTVPGYVVTPFEQDDWVALDAQADARAALAAFEGLRRINIAFFRGLTAEQRRAPFQHPERGAIDAGWIAGVLAGHDRHHLRHLEIIAGAA